MAGPTPEASSGGLFGPIRALYDWVLSFAESPYGPAALFVLAFCESSFFPIPPDPLLIALCLGAVRRSLGFAALCTVASVLGGAFGYWIGMSAFEVIGRPIIDFYGKADAYEALAVEFRNNGNMAVFIAALTPVPYKLVTITAGALSMDVPAFLGASVIGRGARFFLLAVLIRWKGEAIADFIHRRFELLTVTFGVLVVFGFVAFRMLLH